MKHLVSLVDGTWLTPTHIGGGGIYSNIHRLNLVLADEYARDEKPQIVFYSRGLGAVSGIRKYTAGGFAYGIKEEIEDVYINIASNYVRTDKIYLYGFSRGAVIARVVAALISHVGLLLPWKLDKFPELWDHYKSGRAFEDSPEFCHPKVEIEFLGVFDTVYGGNNSAGRFQQRLKFSGKSLSRYVKHAVHLLAIDEQRPFFRPLLWEDSDDHEGLEQIGMPGVHGDVGGIYAADFLGLISFLTMVERTISKTKLAFELNRLEEMKNTAKLAFISNNISVAQEWSRLWRVICLNRKHHRIPLEGGSKQLRHFITDMIHGNEVTIRMSGNKKRYVVRGEFKDLPPLGKHASYNWKWD
jgi:uncharacterized protein (DUF2235 family)